MSSHSELSQAMATAQYHLPAGWKITDLRRGAQGFNASPMAPQARALQAEQPRADNAGDPWTAIAVGPKGERVEKSGRDGQDALRRLIYEVQRAAR